MISLSNCGLSTNKNLKISPFRTHDSTLLFHFSLLLYNLSMKITLFIPFLSYLFQLTIEINPVVPEIAPKIRVVQ